MNMNVYPEITRDSEVEGDVIYPVIYEDDGAGGVIVVVVDLPGTHDCGATREEAVERVRGAALAIIQSLMDDRRDVPDPTPPAGRPVVVLPSQAWTKVLLYRALRAKGWRKADLAKAIGADQKAVDRLFRLSHASRWDQVDEAARALGMVLVPTMAAAA